MAKKLFGFQKKKRKGKGAAPDEAMAKGGKPNPFAAFTKKKPGAGHKGYGK